MHAIFFLSIYNRVSIRENLSQGIKQVNGTSYFCYVLKKKYQTIKECDFVVSIFFSLFLSFFFNIYISLECKCFCFGQKHSNRGNNHPRLRFRICNTFSFWRRCFDVQPFMRGRMQGRRRRQVHWRGGPFIPKAHKILQHRILYRADDIIKHLRRAIRLCELAEVQQY